MKNIYHRNRYEGPRTPWRHVSRIHYHAMRIALVLGSWPMLLKLFHMALHVFGIPHTESGF